MAVSSQVPRTAPICTEADLSSPPPLIAMSQLTASGSTQNYQSIFDSTLESYKKKTKNDLVSHPLLAKLETCNSPEAILATLREQIPGFGQSHSSDQNLTRCLNSTVRVVSLLSETIGGAVSLVRLRELVLVSRSSH